MSGSRPRLIVHLGQHKTGSKALQSFLALHADQLRERGIIYPVADVATVPDRAYAISHFHVFARLRLEAMIAGGETAAAARFQAEYGGALPPAESLHAVCAAMEQERIAAGAHTLVLSAEDLFDLHTSHELEFDPGRVRRAAALLAELVRTLGCAPRLVVYLRRPDHLLAAHYAQFVKGPTHEDLTFDRFAALFAPRLRARELLEGWADAFSAENVTVRPYEPARLRGGIVPDFFRQALGFEVPADWPAPPRDRESVNASPGRDHLEFIRRLKRGEIPGGSALTVADVLNDALAGEAASPRARGVEAWLSPAERRALLAGHAADQAAIAARFRDGAATLFSEPEPADDPAWRPYAGLTPAEVRTMARRIAAAVGFKERWRRRLRAWRKG